MLIPFRGEHTAEFLVAVGRCACASTHLFLPYSPKPCERYTQNSSTCCTHCPAGPSPVWQAQAAPVSRAPRPCPHGAPEPRTAPYSPRALSHRSAGPSPAVEGRQPQLVPQSPRCPRNQRPRLTSPTARLSHSHNAVQSSCAESPLLRCKPRRVGGRQP